MEATDYVLNDLLKPPGMRPIRFVPADQSDLFRNTLSLLEQDGYWVGRVNLRKVDTSLALLQRISFAISPPSEMENWGVFGDHLYDLSWMPGNPKGYFFYMEEALGLWQKHTAPAATLTDAFQPISYHWAQRGIRFVVLFELR